MTGCLQIKNNNFYAVLDYTEKGKRKRPWINTHIQAKEGNRKKAEKALNKIIREYKIEPDVPSQNPAFADCICAWLCDIKSHVDEVTFQGYEALTNSHILPFFKPLNYKVKDINIEILQRYFDYEHKSGRLDGKGGLSSRSVKLLKNIINQTLNESVKNGLIMSNPCQFVKMPKIERYQSNFITSSEITKMIEAIREEPLFPLIYVTIYFGLRRSESLGLKWDSVDFERELVTIKHTVSKVKKVVEKNKTKNSASFRSYPLTPEIKTIFINAKHEEEANRSLFGKSYVENDYVFKWPDGKPYSPDYITRKFKKILKKYNLPDIRFHDLRHSCASHLLSSGYNIKDVQEWLGHSDIKVTANTYGHLDVTRKQNIASAMGACLH